jgi:hypothetical protein
MTRSVVEACVVSYPDDVERHVHQEVEPFEGAEQWRAAYYARQPERHARAHKTELADGAGSDGTRD